MFIVKESISLISNICKNKNLDSFNCKIEEYNKENLLCCKNDLSINNIKKNKSNILSNIKSVNEISNDNSNKYNKYISTIEVDDLDYIELL